MPNFLTCDAFLLLRQGQSPTEALGQMPCGSKYGGWSGSNMEKSAASLVAHARSTSMVLSESSPEASVTTCDTPHREFRCLVYLATCIWVLLRALLKRSNCTATPHYHLSDVSACLLRDRAPASCQTIAGQTAPLRGRLKGLSLLLLQLRQVQITPQSLSMQTYTPKAISPHHLAQFRRTYLRRWVPRRLDWLLLHHVLTVISFCPSLIYQRV